MRKLIFNPELNWGHVLMAITFAASTYAQWLGVRSDIKQLKEDVKRHESVVEKMNETQQIMAQTQAVLAQRFADHLEATRERPRSFRDFGSN